MYKRLFSVTLSLAVWSIDAAANSPMEKPSNAKHTTTKTCGTNEEMFKEFVNYLISGEGLRLTAEKCKNQESLKYYNSATPDPGDDPMYREKYAILDAKSPYKILSWNFNKKTDLWEVEVSFNVVDLSERIKSKKSKITFLRYKFDPSKVGCIHPFDTPNVGLILKKCIDESKLGKSDRVAGW